MTKQDQAQTSEPLRSLFNKVSNTTNNPLKESIDSMHENVKLKAELQNANERLLEGSFQLESVRLLVIRLLGDYEATGEALPVETEEAIKEFINCFSKPQQEIIKEGLK